MKINDYNLSQVTQEMIDMLDEIKTLLNFGKYQWTVLATTPTFRGHLGEHVWVLNSTSQILYACGSDGSSTTWIPVAGA